MAEPDIPAPLRAMLRLLAPDEIEILALALHGKLFAPASAAFRRVDELGFLAHLLNETPQPPERLPRIERQVYDERRSAEARAAPLSARLVERYGSWRRACYAAWGLLPDGRSTMGGQPWPTPHDGKSRKFTRDECVQSVRACADAIGRIPSSHQYGRWRAERLRKARRSGTRVRLASYQAILRELAPHRTKRDGWRIVIETVFRDGLS